MRSVEFTLEDLNDSKSQRNRQLVLREATSKVNSGKIPQTSGIQKPQTYHKLIALYILIAVTLLMKYFKIIMLLAIFLLESSNILNSYFIISNFNNVFPSYFYIKTENWIKYLKPRYIKLVKQKREIDKKL